VAASSTPITPAPCFDCASIYVVTMVACPAPPVLALLDGALEGQCVRAGHAWWWCAVEGVLDVIGQYRIKVERRG
jgi:hypothetical protein